MDRLSQLRGEAGSSRDSTLDTSSPPSEAFMTANESSSKYYSLSEVDSTFDISPIKDVSLASANIESDKTIAESDQLISNLSPIGKKDFMDGYKIGKQIEAANILSGGVDIFDDNDNSYDGDELVIDDNAELDDKSNPDMKLTDSEATEPEAVPSKDTEVILQIDGKNVDAIDIGNGLYLYRKEGQEELAAVQIVDDDQQQPSFKFLKVRENAEGNLEVYEEIQIEVPNEVPVKEEKVFNKNVSHVPIKDINKVISDTTSNKIAERKYKSQNVPQPVTTVAKEPETEIIKETQVESKSEPNKKIKFNESRKSPVVGSFTPMTYHSTPNKEGKPLTKTMVDQQLQPSRHSDNIKKTIEVHTDCAKQRPLDSSVKCKDLINDEKNKSVPGEKDSSSDKSILGLSPHKENESKTYVEADDEKDDKVLKETKLGGDETGDALAKKENDTIEKQPSAAEVDKALDLNKSTNINVLDSLKKNESKSSTKNENKDVKEIKEPAEVKLTEVLTKTIPEVENVIDKKSVPAKENESMINNIEDKGDNKEEKDKKDLDVNKINSKADDHSAIVCNKAVEDKHTNKKPIDEVDSAICINKVDQKATYVIESKLDQKVENITENTQGIVKDDNKEQSQIVSDNFKKNLSPKVEDKKNNLLSVKSDDTAKGNLKVEPSEKAVGKPEATLHQNVISGNVTTDQKEDKKQTVSIPENTRQSNKTSVNVDAAIDTKNNVVGKPESTLQQSKISVGKIVEEKIDKKPVLPQRQLNSINPNKEIKHTTTLTSSKTEPPAVAAPTKIEPKVQPKPNEQKEAKTQDIKVAPAKTIPQPKTDIIDKKPLAKVVLPADSKPINNNHAAVPFGKWTEVNRQAFLNKIKESKVPTNSSNGKQIKNSNDLNRRDVLKKIDSQRQSSIIASAKAQELKTESQRQSEIATANTKDFGSATRMGVKQEAEALANKPPATPETKLPLKIEPTILKNSSAPAKKTKQETVVKPQTEVVVVTSTAADVKKESKQRKEINNQDLIDKTIEEIINRPMPVPVPAKNPQEAQSQRCYDEIEMKMNELHGKPFVERPVHELPPAQKLAPKTYPKSEYLKTNVSKPSKIPNLVPFSKTQAKCSKENTTEIDSEEEVIIEHEPITGDMDLDVKKPAKSVVTEKVPIVETVSHSSVDPSKKESIITEKDFDKFARRNSISYENCLTVNFDGKEPHNVIQSVVQKEVGLKTYSKKDSLLHDAKVVAPRNRELFIPNSHPKSAQNSKFGHTVEDDGKHYQSKVKMAYQTAMTAKRQMERPITIIEDRPVKVVYVDTNTEFISNQLNVQGKELSPAKKTLTSALSIATDLQDSDNTLDSIEGEKNIDETKIKTKHQRKQVLTPVEAPELELIEPNDLGIEVSPKKKRKTEEKVEKSPKTLVPKKSYLLGRGNTLEDSPIKSFDFTKSSQRETLSQDSSHISHQNTASAIDSLVKAAELLETQSGNNMAAKVSPDTPTPDGQQNTPVKRGRGRPRKYPLPEGTPDKPQVPSPQKKPRLIDAKVVKSKDSDDDFSSDDDAMVKENWTMGKINENIVCPICKKLFRSENVVFKHVKHCTGPSPSRSDSENKSPRRYRESQESESRSYESKSEDMEIEESETLHKERTKRKSKDSQQKVAEKDEIIVIEDTPLKAKPDKKEERKPDPKTMVNKNKGPDKPSSLVCEFCGKIFRQLSYLVSHRLQHGKEDAKKPEFVPAKSNKTVLNCEVCKKEFRFLHHLVQHRLIHNPSNSSGKLSRKSSSEQSDKSSKEQNTKANNPPAADPPAAPADPPAEDGSAGFRCEPCDKSFRKLHHLVEHRETHDGINRQNNRAAPPSHDRPPPPPQCDVCKKTFRKLHHLVEHKEQHVETSSEKSDDKSIKSSLSTKDIIHECPLCYMVFPNENSLNKHMVFCQRKKKQASKQVKQTEENESVQENTDTIKVDEEKAEDIDDDVTIVSEEIVKERPAQEVTKSAVETPVENKIKITEEPVKQTAQPTVQKESLKPNTTETEKKEDNKPVDEPVKPIPAKTEVTPDIPEKVKKSDDAESKPKIHETPRKKTPAKEKVTPIVPKRLKPNVPSVVEAPAPKPTESSDDDEARYMLNPDYKFEDNEGKVFMKVRANKRNSLQIERPNSKDLVTRRISLQHPLKVPRLKAKAVQSKPSPSPPVSVKPVIKVSKPETVPSTDSDDSDVKYSFPEKPPTVKAIKLNHPEILEKESVKKTQRKSLAEKRKSLSSIAKRKSLGKGVAKHKVKPSPVKQVRKRTTEVEHRCDCGQLFSSAALLARHTTLAHTPPRIRRRRSPPPDPHPAPKPATKPPRKSNIPAPTKPSADSRKSSVNRDTGIQKTTTKRKSSIKTEPKTPNETRKTPRSTDKSDAKSAKLRRTTTAHKGVPVPEKMRKLMEKEKSKK